MADVGGMIGAALNFWETSIELKSGPASKGFGGNTGVPCTFLACACELLALVAVENVGALVKGFKVVWFGSGKGFEDVWFGIGNGTAGFNEVAAACLIEDINEGEIDWDNSTGARGDDNDDICTDPPAAPTGAIGGCDDGNCTDPPAGAATPTDPTGDCDDDICINPPIGAAIDAAKGITDAGTELQPDEALGDAVPVAAGLEDNLKEPPLTGPLGKAD